MKNRKDDWNSASYDFNFVVKPPEVNSPMWEERVQEAKDTAYVITEGTQLLIFLAFIMQVVAYIASFVKRQCFQIFGSSCRQHNRIYFELGIH